MYAEVTVSTELEAGEPAVEPMLDKMAVGGTYADMAEATGPEGCVPVAESILGKVNETIVPVYELRFDMVNVSVVFIPDTVTVVSGNSIGAGTLWLMVASGGGVGWFVLSTMWAIVEGVTV